MQSKRAGCSYTNDCSVVQYLVVKQAYNSRLITLRQSYNSSTTVVSQSSNSEYRRKAAVRSISHLAIVHHAVV